MGPFFWQNFVFLGGFDELARSFANHIYPQEFAPFRSSRQLGKAALIAI
jgi:hypothetical protein